MKALYNERDLWWEARQRNMNPGFKQKLKELLIKVTSLSLPGAGPVKRYWEMSALAARSDVVFMPDFNKYRKRRLKAYQDAGCKAFMGRIVGPIRWVQGNWGYAVDDFWYDFLNQAAALGVVDQTIGYIVHNPFESWSVNGATGETIHTELVDEYTSGGYMPRAFMIDHEINTCWTSVGREIKITVPNLITSLAENSLNLWKKYKRTVSAYSADWFMSQNGWDEHYTYFTNMNKPESQGGEGTQRPLIMAWYGQNMTKQYSSMQQVGTDLFVPTPKQVSELLYCGYQANAWQFSPTVRINTGNLDGSDDTIGVDMNISLDPAKMFFYNFGLIEPGATEPPPPPPPDEEPTELALRVRELELKQAGLEAWAGSFPVPFGK